MQTQGVHCTEESSDTCLEGLDGGYFVMSIFSNVRAHPLLALDDEFKKKETKKERDRGRVMRKKIRFD